LKVRVGVGLPPWWRWKHFCPDVHWPAEKESTGERAGDLAELNWAYADFWWWRSLTQDQKIIVDPSRVFREHARPHVENVVSPDPVPAAEPEPIQQKGGRPENPVWELARPIAVVWMDENGAPLPGDGEQAELERHISEWLGEKRKFSASESTVRNHVSIWIKEYRAARA
jgi:hypothetical protein